ncbi:uncharacterized protein [Henckelia pumila]|uniref:uncharacterized protein n=1 Tax=Henckelia pumila TaxID=405737 RepID=UPI003C6DF0FE
MGPACGDSSRARKAALRNIPRQDHSPHQVRNKDICEVSKVSREMTFTDSDREFPLVEHNDVLVISATVSNHWVKNILVDSGSSADIVFYNAFAKMGIDNAQLTPVNTPLIGFSREVVEALGEVTVPLSLGFYPKRVTKMVKFLFPMSEGVGEAIGDSRLARECHANVLRDSASCKRKIRADEISLKKRKQPSAVESSPDQVHTIEGDFERKKNLEATKALKRIDIIQGNSAKTLKIGTEMTPELEELLTVFLQKNADVFAWQGEFLPGIPYEYTLHHLNVDPRIKPVKQKKRSFGAEKNKHILAEVENLVKNNYIMPVSHPEWMTNVVLVPKQGGKWRLCIDFIDLKKACPKDLFPLPRINLLVESTAGCELFTFMDAYQGYNQIALAPKTKRKLVSLPTMVSTVTK